LLTASTPSVRADEAAAQATQPPGDLADFLVKPAEAAITARDFGLAISLWRGVVAIRGEGDDSVLKLADAWTLAGEFESAADELQHYAAATQDLDKKTAALRQIEDLEARPKGFSTGGDVFQVTFADAQAKEAFKRGHAFFDQKKYDEAARLFKAGIEMSPDLAANGSYKELGEAEDKLGKTDEATDFFLKYLRQRPYGKNAGDLRERLSKLGVLGKLSIDSSFPCEQVWMNREPVPDKLPIASLLVAPGTYRLLCYSEKYHFARYVSVDVTRGGEGKATFAWAIVENKLDPWGRIVLENPDRPNEMNDIGVWDEIGVPVPEDRRSLRVVMKSADNSKKKEMLLKLEPGQTATLEW
jgi:tetratricopeptide (TPR) repeat protein